MKSTRLIGIFMVALILTSFKIGAEESTSKPSFKGWKGPVLQEGLKPVPYKTSDIAEGTYVLRLRNGNQTKEIYLDSKKKDEEGILFRPRALALTEEAVQNMSTMPMMMRDDVKNKEVKHIEPFMFYSSKNYMIEFYGIFTHLKGHFFIWGNYRLLKIKPGSVNKVDSTFRKGHPMLATGTFGIVGEKYKALLTDERLSNRPKKGSRFGNDRVDGKLLINRKWVLSSYVIIDRLGNELFEEKITDQKVHIILSENEKFEFMLNVVSGRGVYIYEDPYLLLFINVGDDQKQINVEILKHADNVIWVNNFLEDTPEKKTSQTRYLLKFVSKK